MMVERENEDLIKRVEVEQYRQRADQLQIANAELTSGGASRLLGVASVFLTGLVSSEE